MRELNTQSTHTSMFYTNCTPQLQKCEEDVKDTSSRPWKNSASSESEFYRYRSEALKYFNGVSLKRENPREGTSSAWSPGIGKAVTCFSRSSDVSLPFAAGSAATSCPQRRPCIMVNETSVVGCQSGMPLPPMPLSLFASLFLFLAFFFVAAVRSSFAAFVSYSELSRDP